MRLSNILAISLALTTGTIAAPVASIDTNLVIRDAYPAGGWTGLIPWGVKQAKKLIKPKPKLSKEESFKLPALGTKSDKNFVAPPPDPKARPPKTSPFDGPTRLPKFKPVLGKIPEKKKVGR